MPHCKNTLTVPEHRMRKREERERRWETGRWDGERKEFLTMYTAWSVINAQVLPESRGFQFNFKPQKARSSCRGECRRRIRAIICYLTKITKGEFISCVDLNKWGSREQSWQYPPCFCEQRNSQVHFQVPSLSSPAPCKKMSHCRDCGTDLLSPAPSHLLRW